MTVDAARQHSPGACRDRAASSRHRLALSIAALCALIAPLVAPTRLVAAEPAQPAQPRSSAHDIDAELAARPTPEAVLALALRQSPELAESSARSTAAGALAEASARLPDAEVEYQLWAAPLRRPYALGDAEMHMFGVRQAFPALGSLSARARAARATANATREQQHAREQQLVLEVRRAYAEYRLRWRELGYHREHAALAGQLLEAVRGTYQGARSGQREVVHAMLELSRLHRDLASVERARNTARAQLNTLMARPVASALGEPLPLEPRRLALSRTDLARALGARRPELAALRSGVDASEQELEAAQASARFPSLMLGVQYMYMPPSDEPHNYGVTLSMSLPWLNPRYGEEVRAREAELAAGRSAAAGLENMLGLELYSALQRFEAAQDAWESVDRQLLPLAEQSLEVTLGSYRAGQAELRQVLEALRDLLDLRVEREQQVADWDMALAELERAAGRTLRDGTQALKE